MNLSRTLLVAMMLVPCAALAQGWPAKGRELKVVVGYPAGSGADTSVAPEGAELYVLEHRGGLARVEWGSSEAWVVAGQLRELTRP